MNKVEISGRLTKDPDVREVQTQNGNMTVARYTLAVDRRMKNEEGQTADFINCVAFGRNGQFAEKYLRKGTKIIVCGKIQTGSYTNKDGQKVYTTEVVADEQEFAESKRTNTAAGGGDDNIQQQANYQPAQPAQQAQPTPQPAPQQTVQQTQKPANEEMNNYYNQQASYEYDNNAFDHDPMYM